MRKASEETPGTVEGWTHILRFGTLSIKTITGRGRELADIMEQRNVDICAYSKQSGKGLKRGTLEVDANYSKMGLMEQKMG